MRISRILSLRKMFFVDLCYISIFYAHMRAIP